MDICGNTEKQLLKGYTIFQSQRLSACVQKKLLLKKKKREHFFGIVQDVVTESSSGLRSIHTEIE